MKAHVQLLLAVVLIGVCPLRLAAQSTDTPLKPYPNATGKINATGYATGRTWILVQFKGDALYLYTNESCGADHIRELKRLAQQGEGLDAYIRKHVWKSYAKKLR
jgi:hypothetical protein